MWSIVYLSKVYQNLQQIDGMLHTFYVMLPPRSRADNKLIMKKDTSTVAYSSPEAEVIDLGIEAIMSSSPVDPGHNEKTEVEELNP